jgi:hypothetical protein
MDTQQPIYKPSTVLDLRDLVIIKTILEKGFRSNIFTKQEEHAVKQIQDKIVTILDGAAKFAKDNNLIKK